MNTDFIRGIVVPILTPLDADERSALKRAMTEEQRFYFAAFVRREAKLLEEKYGRG